MRSQSQDGSHMPGSQPASGSVIQAPSGGLQDLTNPTTQQHMAQASLLMKFSKQVSLLKGGQWIFETLDCLKSKCS